MALTANATFAVRRGTGGDYTDLSDQPAGIASYQTTDTARTRPVPSIPGQLAIQLLDIRDGNVTFTVDDNPRTNPLFFLYSGQTFQIRVRREGDGSGKPEDVYTGIASINLNNAEGGARSYQVTLTVSALASADQS